MRGRAVVISVFVVCLGVVALGTTAACTDYGETPATEADAGPAMGDRGGKCFADGQCKTGLTCIDNAICVMTGTGLDGAAVPTTDASSNADAADADDGATCPQLSISTSGIVCGKVACPLDHICCAHGNNIGKCVDPAFCEPDFLIHCDTSSDCASGDTCCVVGIKSPGINGCPLTSITSSRCATDATCTLGGGTAVCEPGTVTNCACRVTEARFEDGTRMGVLGLCSD